jgi:hypothetical protein
VERVRGSAAPAFQNTLQKTPGPAVNQLQLEEKSKGDLQKNLQKNHLAEPFIPQNQEGLKWLLF